MPGLHDCSSKAWPLNHNLAHPTPHLANFPRLRGRCENVSGWHVGEADPLIDTRPLRKTQGEVVRDFLSQFSDISRVVVLLGFLALTVPTLGYIIDASWSTEAGGHGPIVLVTGLWLIWRNWDEVRAVRTVPPLGRVMALFIPLLILAIAAKITQIIEIEGYIVYGVVLAVLYGLIGGRAMKILAFPLLYLAFIIPPPDTLVAAVTNPLKTLISEYSVKLLYKFGYPIGGQGVTIQIGQYQLLVAQACSGLNSIVSLSAITSFYVYLQRGVRPAYSLFLLTMILPVAVFANFIRVLILILLTYYAGEAAAQGFLHNFAGLTMFVTALLTIFAIDSAASKVFERSRRIGA
jgi:exosortase